MRISNTIQAARFVLALLAVMVLTGSMSATAQTPTVTDIHSFSRTTGIGSNTDGAIPAATLLQATDGSFYGTTQWGGANDPGTIFKITTSGALTTLHTFSATNNFANSDGAWPVAALIQARDGKLYGTTQYGGAHGNGTIFKITTSGKLTTLHTFSAAGTNDTNADGASIMAALIQARDGNLYGTAEIGGANDSGTIFKITPSGSFTMLYSLGGSDGASPSGGLIQASDGNLYGTAYQGGTNGNGTIFKITPSGSFTTLYSFSALDSFNSNSDGDCPYAGLVQASDGNLYGTAFDGGASDNGTIFKITPSGSFTTLYSFSGSDGARPYAGLVQASDGNLYGTCGRGGSNGIGTVFKITTSGVLTSLYSFRARSSTLPYVNSDGAWPFAGLTVGTDGCLYGTTQIGGVYGGGTVFRLSGIYPVPVLTGLNPSSSNAGGTAFTLNVKGASFQTFSTVNWNGGPLKTTYVSATTLAAAVPASLIAAPGHAKVNVVTPAGGGTSNSKSFTVVVTTLTLPAASATKSGTGAYTAGLTLKNVGFLSAPSVKITKASLGSAPTTTTLPVSLGSIAGGTTASTSLGFAASAGSSGSVVVLKVSGTFTGGTFNDSLKVTLP